MKMYKKLIPSLIILLFFIRVYAAEALFLEWQKPQNITDQGFGSFQLLNFEDRNPIAKDKEFFIGAYIPYNIPRDMNEERRLELLFSQKRNKYGDEKSMSKFWSLFETHLNTNSIDQLVVYYTKPDVFTNPLQVPLIEELGFTPYESGSILSILLKAYKNGGLLATQDTFEDHLRDELSFTISGLSSIIHDLREVMKLQISDSLMGQFRNNSDPAIVQAQRLYDIIYSAESSPLRDQFRQEIQAHGINLDQKDVVKQYLVDSMDVLVAIARTSSSLASILKTTQDRYRDGIAAEVSGKRHAYSPTSLKIKLQETLLDLIRLQILLGHKIDNAARFANYVLTNSGEIYEELETTRTLETNQRMANVLKHYDNFLSTQNSCQNYLN